MKLLVTSLILALGVSSSAFAQQVTVDITLNPMGDFKAKTSDVKGEAVVKGDEVSAQNIVVNMKTLKTGVELRDKHTQKHLETAKFPEAVLISATGKGGKGKGKIKIRGIEKDVEGTYKVEGKVLKADFKLNIADFDMKDINYMGVGVEDEVVLHVAIPVKP
ncbi:YceI family protein [Bdellovibrio svalbardensis]|uniref:YceI family protein n=1 Tax=Bdellovibrio svalbardensis TaxID=2972972 RepID=A0ABT6DGS3_9BACT|nr:YceI family protein [Bdellovibrio svalbardensis]MDG0816059.1 YceI family protein [Bdellovibrio svalbardensis]